jgi:hypothetical protein
VTSSKQSCAASTKNEDNPHRVSAICTFDAWDSLLRNAKFQDMDSFNVYRARIVNAATQMKEKFNRFASWWALRVPGWLIYLALFF